ncbi:hypothetical protein QUF74_14640 [Candidatus Halobeggiatoa sp. HSG11]|nr:hypothetical protein [Candidatus Halobeggiatoa sp. HSG11]
MKIIAYGRLNNKQEIELPFYEYLENYAFKTSDEKIKIISRIYQTIKYLYEHKGSMNLPPYIEPYKKTELSVIKIKYSNILIRIAFFTIEDEIVLLEAMDKPKFYDKAKKKKIDREIQLFLDKAEENLTNYMENKIGVDITQEFN